VRGRQFRPTSPSGGFAGYDTTLTQGGDEVDLPCRLKRQGLIVWDASNSVLTSLGLAGVLRVRSAGALPRSEPVWPVSHARPAVSDVALDEVEPVFVVP